MSNSIYGDESSQQTAPNDQIAASHAMSSNQNEIMPNLGHNNLATSHSQTTADVISPEASKILNENDLNSDIALDNIKASQLASPHLTSPTNVQTSNPREPETIDVLEGPANKKLRYDRKRLIILYDKPKYKPIEIQIEQLKLISGDLDILEFKDLEKFSQLDISKRLYYYLNICIEYNDEFESNLRKLNEFLTSMDSFLNEVSEIGYHINFGMNAKWIEQHENDRQEYFNFLNSLSDKCRSKVRHVSVINKYDINTIYLTKKDDLTRLGQEIQQDIDNWDTLKILDYSNNCIRFFPGVKFPDSLEVMNISGSYSLETLSGFKIPKNLKQLIASNNSITSIDSIDFPETLEVLNLMDNRVYFLNYIELPSSLKVLDLSNNRLDNVRGIEFPDTLEQLSISLNPIDNIKGLKLPEGLKYLDLSCIPNESMTGIKFPDLIETLNLQESMTNTRGLKLPNFVKNLNLSHNGVNSINPLKLPNSIEVLNLLNNNIKTLNKVQFPANLKQLYLGNNLITTLKNVLFPTGLEILDLEMDPELDENDKRISSLKDVMLPQGLQVLRLGYQGIKSFESYEIPQGLIELDLSFNDLKLIRNIKFNNQLEVLNISGNQELVEIDQIILPPSLKHLIIPSQLIPNLPSYIIDRANSKELIITKTLPF